LKQASPYYLQIDFFIPIGGRLFLTSKRLIFIPGRFNISPEKPENVTLTLGTINRVEKKTGDMSNLLAGSLRSRLQVHNINVKSFGVKTAAEPGYHILVLFVTGVLYDFQQLRIALSAAAVLWRAGTFSSQTNWNISIYMPFLR